MTKIAVAVSGGIDSLVSAWILKQQSHDIFGIYFITGYEQNSCVNLESISDQIGIKIKTLDCKKQFQHQVVNYFIKTYKQGKTPNPCLKCNPLIKFGTVLDFACKNGASYLGTGHYARVIKDNTQYRLLKGIDKLKDQSYFLAFLSQDQLAKACFPLGNMTKEDVRKLAYENKLVPAVRKESQDVCFIHDNYKQFLADRGGLKNIPGPIKNAKGQIIGKHQGLHLFTIGQRKGINCPASEPYYVIGIDVKNNCLKVGFKKDLLCSQFYVKHINWINQVQTSPISVQVRIRYRHKAVSAILFPVDNKTAKIQFDVPQSAVTPGQGAVFYDNDNILGAGWIDIL